MPKQKSHRGAAKRFSLTKSGLVKRSKAYKHHNLSKKGPKRCRQFRTSAYVSTSEVKTIKKLLPYI